jgi:hypothetical protein
VEDGWRFCLVSIYLVRIIKYLSIIDDSLFLEVISERSWNLELRSRFSEGKEWSYLVLCNCLILSISHNSYLENYCLCLKS